MHIARRAAAALLTTAGLTLLAGATAGAAIADEGATVALKAPLAASLPTDPMLNGVAPGPAPWAIASGAVQLRTDGKLTVAINRLVLVNRGTAGPVHSIDASVYCGEETTAAATTPTVPLTKTGKALIKTTLTLPAQCLAPTVLIHPLGIATLYIAASA